MAGAACPYCGDYLDDDRSCHRCERGGNYDNYPVCPLPEPLPTPAQKRREKEERLKKLEQQQKEEQTRQLAELKAKIDSTIREGGSALRYEIDWRSVLDLQTIRLWLEKSGWGINQMPTSTGSRIIIKPLPGA